MSRSGYSEDSDDVLQYGRWTAQVNSSIRGKRGQKFLRDLVAALDALPEKRLVEGDLEKEGSYCALGALGKYRGVDLETINTHNHGQLSDVFDITEQLARETMYINDDCGSANHEQRWRTIRGWAVKNIRLTDSDIMIKPDAGVPNA